MSGHLIVIPVHNEAASIEAVAAAARRCGPVLVIDDASSDGSAALAEAAGAEIIRLRQRSGKGAVLRRGFAEALARGVARVVTLDGDGQHDAGEIPRLLAEAEQAPGALVVGGRLGDIHGGAAAERAAATIPAERRHAMRVAGFFIDWLTGIALHDTQSGFRVYPCALLAEIRPRRGGFVLETEMLVRAARAGWPIVEVPVAARYFPARRSHFRALRDGVAVGAFLAGHGLKRWGAEIAALAAAAVRPFTPAVARARHRDLAVATMPYRHHPAALMAQVGAFALNRVARSWERWSRSGDARRLGLAAAASAGLPLLLVAVALRRPCAALGLDVVGAVVERLYSQARLAGTLPSAAWAGHTVSR